MFVAAEDLRRVPGALLYLARYNKAAHPYAAIASQTSMARRLLGLMGYEDDALDDNMLVLANVDETALDAFCEFAQREVVISKGDRAAEKPPSDSGNAPDISAVQIYLLNASQLDRRCVSVEYCSALDGVLSLLGKIPNGSSSEAELEKLHMLFVWQSETVFSSFKPVAVFEDVAPVSVGMLPLANPPESREQDCETLVQEALDLLEANLNFFRYRAFVRLIHYFVGLVVESSGAYDQRSISKNDPNFAAALAESDVTLRLPHLLGYEEVETVFPNAIYLVNFEANETMLRKFLEIGIKVIVIMKGDPARCIAVGDVGTVPELVVQIAYHFKIICELLCTQSYQHILPSLTNEVTYSLEFIKKATERLEIMSLDTDCYLLFECMKTDMLTYLATADKALERFNLQNDIDEVGQLLAVELNSILPFELIHFMIYLGNVGTMLGIALSEQMVDPASASTYLTVVENLQTGSLSEEYMAVSDEVQALVLKSVTDPLEVKERSRVRELCVWQAENFLTHFRPEVFDVTGYSEQLTAIAERNHLCLCPRCDAAVEVDNWQNSQLMKLLEQEKYDDLYTACLSSVSLTSSSFQVLRSKLEQLLWKQESISTGIQQELDELQMSLKMVKSNVVVKTLEGVVERKLIELEHVSKTLYKLKQIHHHLGHIGDQRKTNDIDDLTLLDMLKRIALNARSDRSRLLELLSLTSAYS